jgi:hypothetical protein
MFNNRLRDPFEYVFSTGGTLHENALVGMIIERATGRPARDLLVQARPTAPADTTVVYPARTDSSGSYALRYLPPGSYTVTAFQDRNRSRTPELIELQAQERLEIATADTVFLNLAVLEGDTMPARLTRAEVVGPALVRLRFDDYLDPDATLALVGTVLARSDSLPGTLQIRQILHEHRFLAIRAGTAATPAPGDTSAARPTPADTTVTPARGARAVPVPTNFVGRAPGADSATAALLDLTLPSQVLYAELADSLPFAVEHTFRIQGVANLAGLIAGADSVQVVREAPPLAPPPPAPPRPPAPR